MILPEERSNSLVSQDIRQRFIIAIVADGFEETATIVLLSSLRQAGLYVKSVGLTSGLVNSARGMRLEPDFTLTDLDCLSNTTIISVVVLPEGRQSLSRLEVDPRVHRLLRQVIAQRGQIVTSCEGLRVLRAARVGIDEPGECIDGKRMPVILREPRQPLETFVRDLIRRLKQPLQA